MMNVDYFHHSCHSRQSLRLDGPPTPRLIRSGCTCRGLQDKRSTEGFFPSVTTDHLTWDVLPEFILGHHS
eukprot:12824413-Ditylum_brightwellii.AAC.1